MAAITPCIHEVAGMLEGLLKACQAHVHVSFLALILHFFSILRQSSPVQGTMSAAHDHQASKQAVMTPGSPKAESQLLLMKGGYRWNAHVALLIPIANLRNREVYIQQNVKLECWASPVTVKRLTLQPITQAAITM